MLLRIFYVVLLFAGFEAHAADIAIEQPWARATPGRAPTGAAYLTLVNRGAEPDRLVGAATPAAAKAELHDHQPAANQPAGHSGHVTEMRPVAEIQVKPGETVVLKPGALHLMLVGLKAPLREGERFPVILRFARAGEVTIQVSVGKAGSIGPPK